MAKKTSKRPYLYPVLIESVGKHTTSKYLANSVEDKKTIGLEILKDWKDSQYLQLDNTVSKTFEEYVKKETEGMTVKELQELSVGKTAKMKIQVGKYNSPSTPVEQLAKLKRQYDLENEYNQAVSLALTSLKKKDGAAAWEVIDYFQGAEYMSVRTSTFDNVEYK